MFERLDQFSDMLKSTIEFTQTNGHQDNSHDFRFVGHEDRVHMLRGIRLQFSHFDDTNLVGWVFKASLTFIRHQPIRSLIWLLFI